jgi:hypothetical protein
MEVAAWLGCDGNVHGFPAAERNSGEESPLIFDGFREGKEGVKERVCGGITGAKIGVVLILEGVGESRSHRFQREGREAVPR